MEKTIMINGVRRRMKASALIPRLYRYQFGRDLVRDMNGLRKAYTRAISLPEDATEEERSEAQLSALDLTVFENIAWLMLRHAGEDIPNTPDEWLDSIDGVFSVYEILPVVLELWEAGQLTTAVPRKK